MTRRKASKPAAMVAAVRELPKCECQKDRLPGPRAADITDPDVLLRTAGYLGSLCVSGSITISLPSKTAWRLAEVLIGAADMMLAKGDHAAQARIGELLQSPGVQAVLANRKANAERAAELVS